MSRIICGMFDRTLDADAALEEFKREGFQRSEVDAFYVAAGQHAMTPVGGDSPHSSEGSRTAGIGAGLGAATGAVVGGVAGWVISSAGDLGLVVIPSPRASAPTSARSPARWRACAVASAPPQASSTRSSCAADA